MMTTKYDRQGEDDEIAGSGLGGKDSVEGTL